MLIATFFSSTVLIYLETDCLSLSKSLILMVFIAVSMIFNNIIRSILFLIQIFCDLLMVIASWISLILRSMLILMLILDTPLEFMLKYSATLLSVFLFSTWQHYKLKMFIHNLFNQIMMLKHCYLLLLIMSLCKSMNSDSYLLIITDMRQVQLMCELRHGGVN